MILADTSVWIPYARRQFGMPAVAALRSLLRDKSVAITGMVMAEVIQGTRPADGSELQDLLIRLPFLDADKTSWLEAGKLSQALQRQGLPTPLSDLVIGVVARAHGCAVLARDSHFERVPELTLHQVGE